MADYHQIEYTIDKNGRVTERVLTGQGKQCLDLTADVESALGAAGERTFLPEYDKDVQVIEELPSSNQNWA